MLVKNFEESHAKFTQLDKMSKLWYIDQFVVLSLNFTQKRRKVMKASLFNLLLTLDYHCQEGKTSGEIIK